MDATKNESLIEAYMGNREITREKAIEEIGKDSLRTRLDTYLDWNGIIGFTGQIMLIVEAGE